MLKHKHILLSTVILTALSITQNTDAQTSEKTTAIAQKQQSRVIPRLKISTEKTYKALDVQVQLPVAKEVKLFTTTSNVQSPALVKTPLSIKTFPVAAAKPIKTIETASVVPLVKMLEFIPEPLIEQPEAQPKNLVEIKPEEYKMIQALMFLDYQKKYDLAMPLFVELMEHPEYKNQAVFHYAQTALGLKLYSEFRHKMIQVAKEATDQELKRQAVEMLVKNIQYLEISDIGLIDPLAKSYNIDTLNHPAYLLKKAKYHSEKGELSEFESALLMIPTSAKEYNEGVLLKAVLNYRSGDLDNAIQELVLLWPSIEENKRDPLRNLAAITLARMFFQKAEYKQAYKYYLLVDKSSAQWLQSMVEQAWTQVLAGDNEGAAGNMFTLHTDFFKNAYAPETYIVRTVGYLNLCQYGDGVHVLDDLNKKYKSIFDKLSAYQKNNEQPINYYDLVKQFFKNPSQEDFDGVPRAFVVELARHPQYMNIQKQINTYEDENSRFNKLTIDLIKKERDSRLQMLKAKNEYLAAKREGRKGADLVSLEKKYLTLGVENLIYSRAREGIKKMREAAVARLTSEENTLRVKAGLNLQNRYSEFVAVLDHLVDQKEVLSYEIYSGAGEHIRFQMAGGEIKDRSSASITPDDKDNYKWKFKGEVWDDEIGHYRSSLKNVCPKEELASNNQD